MPQVVEGQSLNLRGELEPTNEVLRRLCHVLDANQYLRLVVVNHSMTILCMNQDCHDQLFRPARSSRCED